MTRDKDADESLTYDLGAGTGDVDNSAFALDGSTVETTEEFDYETDSSYSIRVSTEDSESAIHEEQIGITVNAPPLAEISATELDEVVPTTAFEATEFLYTGSDPVQPNVDTGTIESERVAVLRGRVVDEAGYSLSAAVVSAPDFPEYGQTLTREDGRFFFTVNGGTEILLRYQLNGYAPSEQLEEPPVQEYDWYEDVVLAELDNVEDEIRLDGGATNAQAFEGSVVSDGDGPRSQTLIFPPGTEAEMESGSGATQAVEEGTLRVTEFTTGGDGPETMPGDLPRSSRYTYAAEYSFDEAIAPTPRRSPSQNRWSAISTISLSCRSARMCRLAPSTASAASGCLRLTVASSRFSPSLAGMRFSMSMDRPRPRPKAARRARRHRG